MLFVGVCIALFFAYHLYKRIVHPNVDLKGAETTLIYIPSQSTIDDVYIILEEKDVIKNMASFKSDGEDSFKSPAPRPTCAENYYLSRNEGKI